MRYYSTNHQSPKVSLADAIMHSEAPDGGLYMPDRLPRIPQAFFNNIADMSVTDISYFIANSLFGNDFQSSSIKTIGEQTFSFPLPLVEIEPRIYALELFHGPTGNVKDIAARFTARMLRSITKDSNRPLNLLLSTHGNSGSAIAHSCVGIDGTNVFALCPRTTPAAKFNAIATMGPNIYAIKVNGTIDDCRKMLFSALSDPKLNEMALFSSANSVNIGRVLPHAICYFIAYAQLLARCPKHGPLFFSVPCGNGGALMAGYMASLMGLPASRIIASCNANASFARFMANGKAEDCPPASSPTLAYAMDTCRPTNIPRFIDICSGNTQSLRKLLDTSVCSDADIARTIDDVRSRTGYLLDPHSAVAYKGLKDHLPKGACGIVMASGNPQRQAAGQRAERASRPYDTMIPPTYPALRKFITTILQSK